MKPLSYARTFLFLLRTKIVYILKVHVFGLQKICGVSVDYLENPMLKYPRNLECWCGSGDKAKHCCLPRQVAVLPAGMAHQLRAYIKCVDGKE